MSLTSLKFSRVGPESTLGPVTLGWVTDTSMTVFNRIVSPKSLPTQKQIYSIQFVLSDWKIVHVLQNPKLYCTTHEAKNLELRREQGFLSPVVWLSRGKRSAFSECFSCQMCSENEHPWWLLHVALIFSFLKLKSTTCLLFSRTKWVSVSHHHLKTTQHKIWKRLFNCIVESWFDCHVRLKHTMKTHRQAQLTEKSLPVSVDSWSSTCLVPEHLFAWQSPQSIHHRPLFWPNEMFKGITS